MDPELLKAVQAIGRTLQPQVWPHTFMDWAQVILVVVTAVTLAVLIKYTLETMTLRKVTQDLLAESQKQSEYSLMPIVVMTTRHETDRGNFFVVKNTGKGPALNTRTDPIYHDRGTRSVFHHRTAIGAGEQEDAPLYMDLRPGSLRPADFAQILRNQPTPPVLPTKIVYQSATGSWYETSHTIKLTGNGTDLIIYFDGFRKLPGAPAVVA
jgi:hypothetical protein